MWGHDVLQPGERAWTHAPARDALSQGRSVTCRIAMKIFHCAAFKTSAGDSEEAGAVCRQAGFWRGNRWQI